MDKDKKETSKSEVKETKEVKEEKSDAEKAQDRMNEIRKEYGGESNIPIGHEYWGLRNEHQRLTSK